VTNGAKGLPAVVVAAVEHGWSVLPVGLHKKPLLAEWGPLQITPASLDQAEEWNSNLHPAGWAVITGAVSGRVVVDFDDDAGLETMRKHGIQPHLRTGSGGAHEHVSHPGFHIPTWSGKTKPALAQALPGVDLRGDGGYAVFLGRNTDGPYKRLRPLSEPDPWAGELINKLVPLIAEQEGACSVSEQQPVRDPLYAERVSVSAEEIFTIYLEKERNGAARNDTGIQLACQLRDNGFSQDEAASVMLRYARAVKQTNTKGRLEPYADAEALATVRSAYSRPAREPWASRRSDRVAEPSPPKQEAGSAKVNGSQAKARSLIVSPFQEVEMKPVHWLWPKRIARAKVNLVAGNPGLGKSQLTTEIAAMVSAGRRWPDDAAPDVKGNVIFLSAEDDPADTMRPRLEAVGADLKRVFYVKSVLAGYTGEGKEIHRGFCLAQDLDALAATMKDIGDVALVVLDPISAYLGDVDSHRNAEVRALLAPLSELAGQFEAAIIAISHLNKTAGTEALMRVTGSLAFVAAARTAHLVAQDPEDKSRRLFLPIKNNLAEDTGGLAFRIVGVELPSAYGLIETSKIVWQPEPVTMTADEAIRIQDPEQRSALREAGEWLEEVLRDPVPAAEVLRRARKDGIAEKTLRRAAETLKVLRQKSGKGGWVWSLWTPGQDGQDSQDGQREGLGGDGHLGVTDLEF
jgi:hypothetical protein